MKKSFDERFTDFADLVSEGMGKWWVTALSVIAILIWLASGPFFHYSDTWQLLVNTPTTVIELWIGFLLAAAANRVEKRTHQVLEHIEQLVADEDEEIKKLQPKRRRRTHE